MKLSDIVAEQIQTDDWFFLAGELYRVGLVTAYHNGTIGIQAYNPHQGAPAQLDLINITVPKRLPLQILNQ